LAQTPFDKPRTLWASWSIETGNKSVRFGRDMGYRSVIYLPLEEDNYNKGHNYLIYLTLKDIRRWRGPFDFGPSLVDDCKPRHLLSYYTQTLVIALTCLRILNAIVP